MTRRWGPAYNAWRTAVAIRDGEKCYLCGERVCKRHGIHAMLILEHKNNDRDDYSFGNLGLAHRCCNGAKNPRGALPSVSVSVKSNPAPRVRGSDGFAPNANRESEPVLRRWVFAIMKANRDYPKPRDWILNNGSAFVGRNPITVDRYLDKMFAELFGMLTEDPTDKGPVVVFTDLGDYDLTVEELELKYPWEGVVKSERYFSLRKDEPKKAGIEKSPHYKK